MVKIPVSVCLIAKNEEKFLEECLKRLQPYGFEIIVTDTGSTDRTKEIAEKYADKVYEFPWINDFSAARNFCAEKANNDWILSLDCDEFVESINTKELLGLAKKYPKGIGSIQMKMLLLRKRGGLDYSVEKVARFYNRNYYRFVSAIHEQLEAYKPEYDEYGNKQLTLFTISADIVHQGYAQSKEIMAAKQERNLGILYKELEKDPDNAYLQFQIAQSLNLQGKLEEAIDYFERVLSYQMEGNLLYIQITIIELIKVYVRAGKPEKALEVMQKYDGKCNTAKFTFVEACFYFDRHEWMKSLLYFLKTINMNDANTLGADLLLCYDKIIDLYMAMGDEKSAALFQKKYEECVKENERVFETMESVKE